jgi:hypothetical protein
MTRSELLKYEGESVRLDYNTKIGPQSRTGVIYSVTMKVVIFWPLEEDKEIPIPIDNIQNLTYV